MEKRTFKIKAISPGPLMTIAAWVGIFSYIVGLITHAVSLGPSSGILDFLQRYGLLLILNLIVNALLWAVVVALGLRFINFLLARSGGLAFEFEVSPIEEAKPSSAPLPKFTPPPSDPPDSRRRRAEGEQALDAASKLLRR